MLHIREKLVRIDLMLAEHDRDQVAQHERATGNALLVIVLTSTMADAVLFASLVLQRCFHEPLDG